VTGLSSFIRTAPKLFYVLAVVDLLKNLLGLAQVFIDGTFQHMDYGAPRLQLFASLLAAIVYAAQWVAYGIFATLLIAIHDAVAQRGTDVPEGEAPE
jgi:hypothetical protein